MAQDREVIAQEVFQVSSEAKLAVETLGAFIDERYAPWVRDHVGDDAAALVRVYFSDWLAEPLGAISAWRIESWRRHQLDSFAQPLLVTRQLQALDKCLNKAVEWLLIERNPLKDVSLDTVTDFVVELFEGGVGHGYLREGWAPVGVTWAWSLGKEARLELPPVSTEADYFLKMQITGTYKNKPQRVFVDVNEVRVGMLVCRGPAAYEFFVPASALKARDRVNVVLQVPDSCRPVDFGDGGDRRFLGLRVAKMELRSIAKSELEKQLQPAAADDLPGILVQRAALQEMVSLGSNCEFGFVQRFVGAEPMSLLRWAFVPIDKLINGLEKQFAGLSAPDALDVQVNPDGEFVIEDKVYGYRRHTFVFVQSSVLERVQRSEFVRVGVLSKTLLHELREHNKLFVYHDAGISKLADIQRLLRALNTYGENTLLWIVNAPSTAQVGEVRQIERGLIQGYVSGFQTGQINGRSPHVPSWIKVAYRAHQIWRKNKDSQEQARVEQQLQSVPQK